MNLECPRRTTRTTRTTLVTFLFQQTLFLRCHTLGQYRTALYLFGAFFCYVCPHGLHPTLLWVLLQRAYCAPSTTTVDTFLTRRIHTHTSKLAPYTCPSLHTSLRWYLVFLWRTTRTTPLTLTTRTTPCFLHLLRQTPILRCHTWAVSFGILYFGFFVSWSARTVCIPRFCGAYCSVRYCAPSTTTVATH